MQMEVHIPLYEIIVFLMGIYYIKVSERALFGVQKYSDDAFQDNPYRQITTKVIFLGLIVWTYTKLEKVDVKEFEKFPNDQMPC